MPGEHKRRRPPSWLETRPVAGPNRIGDAPAYQLRIKLWHPYFWLCVVRGLFRRRPGRPVDPTPSSPPHAEPSAAPTEATTAHPEHLHQRGREDG